jgi:signal transduction histidine kinase
MTETNDHERAMGVLVHDLRTPLGVASGYLRLVRDGRVPQTVEPGALIDKALDALRVISRLCVEADRWLDAAPTARPSATPVVQLLGMLSTGLAARNITLQGVEAIPAGDLLVAGDTTELADAFTEALSAAAQPAPATAQVECARLGEELVLSVRMGEADSRRSAFDPWRCPGLQTAIACRTIVRAGGSWHCDGPERFRAALPWVPVASGDGTSVAI